LKTRPYATYGFCVVLEISKPYKTHKWRKVEFSITPKPG
jgi:hypothetical protein